MPYKYVKEFKISLVLRHLPVNPALVKLKQEIATGLRPAWATLQDPIPTNWKEREKN